MKIFLVCSKSSYGLVPNIKAELERMDHVITTPNGFDQPEKELEIKNLDKGQFQDWKRAMLKKDKEIIEANDAILVLNSDKGEVKNYIGGATFLEIYNAFDQDKKIFLYNPVPEGILKDEIEGMSPTVIHGDLSQIGPQ